MLKLNGTIQYILSSVVFTLHYCTVQEYVTHTLCVLTCIVSQVCLAHSILICFLSSSMRRSILLIGYVTEQHNIELLYLSLQPHDGCKLDLLLLLLPLLPQTVGRHLMSTDTAHPGVYSSLSFYIFYCLFC